MDLYKRLPISGGEPDSLVLFLHGLGADGTDLIGIAQYWADALPNTLFLSPDAPQPCDMAPTGRQWFSLQDRRPEKVLEGVKGASLYLNAFIDHQAEEHGIPMEKVALVGFSQGTMMSLYVALRRPTPFACVLGYSGALVGGDELSADTVTKPPVMLRHGEDDMVVPTQAFHDAKKELDRLGISVTGDTVPGMGHGIDDEGIHDGRDFLVKHLMNDSL